jgi:SWI/SNF-related matrix-associated actin-dependent regulator of chromatin subfamily B protein 1
LFLAGNPADGFMPDEDLRASFLPSLTSGARAMDQVQSFTPILNYLSDGEIERNEKDRDKDMNKRRKRNTRSRRGVALPDREPIRTYRTPAIGFPELDPTTLNIIAAATAPTSRRAAAAAASVTIANMVASENGTSPIMSPSQLPQHQVHQHQHQLQLQQTAPVVAKEKKPKGLFKAPSYPSSVLRPRALVTAPTPWTALDGSSLPPSSEVTSTSANTALSDSKAKIITARRAKELEREAKEKEYADNQHANYIDGVWHCSNCGCPESIAIGRRKGPLGEKSQCGTCGKCVCVGATYFGLTLEYLLGRFWHRHRRPRPVEYNSDAEHHLNLGLKRDTDTVKTPAKKKGGTQRAQSNAAGDAVEPTTPRSKNEPLDGTQPSNDRAVSPASSTSSGSEPPLAQRVKLNGTNHVHPPAVPLGSDSVLSSTSGSPTKASLVSDLLPKITCC